MYKLEAGELNLSKIEREILEFWKQNETFRASISNRTGAEEFIFYDGPPFANGLPHYGHLLTSYIKDTVARFQTMNGKKVERRFGWDCHGLPAEMGVEKELGIQGRIAIQEYGIDKFNAACRTSVMQYAKEWENYINRAGRWVDFDQDYKTMDLPYMQSVIWAFKQLYDKGLIYEDYRVMPYSWKCETPLSNFETRMDNAYREKASKAVTVKFELEDGRKILAWTTTPWTLPSNLALAVHRDVEYVEICIARNLSSQQKIPSLTSSETGEGIDAETLVIAKPLLKKYEKDFGKYSITKEFKGSDLINFKYKPLFPYFKNHPNAFKIIHGDFVTTEDGTGIVHMAPGFGEDDQKACKENGISVVCPIDDGGKFTDEIHNLSVTHDEFELRNITSALDDEFIQKVFAGHEHIMNFDDISKSYRFYIEQREKYGFAPQIIIHNGSRIGIAGLILHDPQLNIIKNNVEVICFLLPEFQRQGLGSKVINLYCKQTLHDLQCNLVIAVTEEINEFSRKTLESCGFESDGLIHDPRANQNVIKMVRREYPTHLTTKNLYARVITQADFPLMKALYQCPNARKFYSKQILSDAEIHEELNLYTALTAKYGHGRMAIFERLTDRFVGLAGIDNVLIESTEKQIGFTFHKEFWGKGYATEIGAKLLAIYGVGEISAYSNKENLGAHKVLAKLGFKDFGEKTYERSGQVRKYFKLDTNILSLAGRQVFECNDDIIKYLKKQNAWLKTEQYMHNYPHCWRTDTPLIYKAVPSWYVAVTKFKDRMVDLNSGKQSSQAGAMPQPTANLSFRPLVESDLLFLSEIYNNPDILNYGWTEVVPDELIAQWIADTSRYAICLKNTSEFVGVGKVGMVIGESDVAGKIEIGYSIKPNFRKQGFATEAATSLLQHAIARYQRSEITLFTAPTNIASQKVANKIGFVDTGRFIKHRGVSCKLYHLPFETERLRAEIVSEAHADLLHDLYNDPEVRQFYYYSDTQFPNKSQLLAEIAYYKRQHTQHNLPRYILFEKQTGKFVGTAGLSYFDPANENLKTGNIEISYLISKDCWRKGYATEIGNAVVRYAFHNFPIETIMACTTADNVKSQQCLEKLGFTKGETINSRPKAGNTKKYTAFNYYLSREIFAKSAPQVASGATEQAGINWMPFHIRDGLFGKWLEGARDWSITRNRFWGCPVPVWKSNNPNNKQLYVFGSIAEMEGFFRESYIADCNIGKNSGKYCRADGSFQITDLHRPFIDELTAPDPFDSKYEISRVTDVLDCWFESGSMPFASIGYPHNLAEYRKNPATFDPKKHLPANLPADFIVEYVAQTRGWFYTMTALSTALFDKAPFKNCICHGVILDSNGQKLSKRLRNYPDPLEVFDTYGSDAMRWFLLSSPVLNGGDLNISKDGQEIKDVVRLVIKPIWNAYTFFAMYANADQITIYEEFLTSQNTMDKYIIAKLLTLQSGANNAMQTYDYQSACKMIEDFLDTLNNWYIRRSKDRFWKPERDEDKLTAYQTLYSVLTNLSRIIAPLLPFTAEAISMRLTPH